MSLILSGSDGLSDVDGSASTPAIRGTDANTGIFFPAADTIAFAEGGTESMRLDSSGNVGIGTTSPAGKLHVAGQTRIQDSANAANYILIGSGANAPRGGNSVMAQTGSMVMGTEAATPLLFVVNAAERARITSDGYLLVNTTTARGRITVSYNTNSSADPTVYFANDGGSGVFATFGETGGVVNGTITRSGSSTAYNTTSDYRLKENVQPMLEALATVAQLKPCTYTWKVNGSVGQGFIAHELQAVVPDCVSGEKDAIDADGNPIYQGVDTSFLVATLTAAIQELKAELDAAKARIAVLEAK